MKFSKNPIKIIDLTEDTDIPVKDTHTRHAAFIDLTGEDCFKLKKSNKSEQIDLTGEVKPIFCIDLTNDNESIEYNNNNNNNHTKSINLTPNSKQSSLIMAKGSGAKTKTNKRKIGVIEPQSGQKKIDQFFVKKEGNLTSVSRANSVSLSVSERNNLNLDFSMGKNETTLKNQLPEQDENIQISGNIIIIKKSPSDDNLIEKKQNLKSNVKTDVYIVNNNNNNSKIMNKTNELVTKPLNKEDSVLVLTELKEYLETSFVTLRNKCIADKKQIILNNNDELNNVVSNYSDDINIKGYELTYYNILEKWKNQPNDVNNMMYNHLFLIASSNLVKTKGITSKSVTFALKNFFNNCDTFELSMLRIYYMFIEGYSQCYHLIAKKESNISSCILSEFGLSQKLNEEPLGKFEIFVRLLQFSFDQIMTIIAPGKAKVQEGKRRSQKERISNESVIDGKKNNEVVFDRNIIEVIIKIIKIWEEFFINYLESYFPDMKNQLQQYFKKLFPIFDMYLELSYYLHLNKDFDDYDLYNEFSQSINSFLSVTLFEFTDSCDTRISELINKQCSDIVGDAVSEYTRKINYLTNTINNSLMNNLFKENYLISFYNQLLNRYIIIDCIKNLIKVHKKHKNANNNTTYQIIKDIFLHVNSFNNIHLKQYKENDKLLGTTLQEVLLNKETKDNKDLDNMLKLILQNK